jgi:low affinity Fe/Cu permease
VYFVLIEMIWSVVMRNAFRRFAVVCADRMGSPWSFLLSVLAILAWLISGPIFHYSNSWQLVINTGTTIVTFLMVFLIQNAQNREAKYTQLKLDELLVAITDARTNLINLDSLSDEDLNQLENEFIERGHAATWMDTKAQQAASVKKGD